MVESVAPDASPRPPLHRASEAAPQWLRAARFGVVGLAVAGILACLYVALVLWRRWPDNPGWHSVVVDVGLLTLFTAPVIWASLHAPRAIGFAAAGALLVWGWMGTWLYGFLWVPGAAALLGCLLPRPHGRALRLHPPPSEPPVGKAG